MQNHFFCISRYTETFEIEQRTSRNLLNTFPSVWKTKEVHTRRSLKQRNGRRRARRELDQSFKIGSNAVNGRERRSFLFFFFFRYTIRGCTRQAWKKEGYRKGRVVYRWRSVFGRIYRYPRWVQSTTPRHHELFHRGLFTPLCCPDRDVHLRSLG